MSPRGPTILILDQDGIGRRLAEARKLRGLTQGGLAMAIPCSKSLISQVERGAKPATPWLVGAVLGRYTSTWRNSWGSRIAAPPNEPTEYTPASRRFASP
jgi:DNA-binding XRE family transcriptional regulator